MMNGIESKMEEKKHGRELSSEQVRLFLLAKKIGEEIAKDYSEIADDYRQGSTMKKIAENYNLEKKYGLNTTMAYHAVQRALEILISREERKILDRKHKKETGRRIYNENIGIFSLGVEELKEFRRINGRKGGLVGGENSYKLGAGIHALSYEEKRKFGKIGIIAQGHKPFSDEEEKYLFKLCENLEYQHRKGRQRGRPNYNLISEELERKFGIKRSADVLMYIMYQSRKKTK